jgi:hypothetical protein
MATELVTLGRKKAVRKNALPRIFWSMTIARTNDRIVWQVTTTSV